MFKKLGLAAALLALGLTSAVAGGIFPGYPSASPPLTGNETIPADTNLSGGVPPQTELITTSQLGQYVNGVAGAQFKNSLICGDFATCPWQRGTSPGGDIANTLTYTADRWFAIGGASSAINVTKQTGASDITTGYAASYRFQRKASNADTTAICFGQVLETVNSVKYQGNTAVLSFIAKSGANFSASNGNIAVTIAYGTGTDGTSANFASGSWTGYTVANAGATAATQAITSTFTRYTISAAIPTSANQVGVKICYTPVGTAGSNDWIEIIGAQLEATSASVSNAVATAFEYLPPEIVAERAQRYFWQVNEGASTQRYALGQATTSTNANIVVPLPVTMRATPTIAATVGSFSVTVAAGTAQACTALAAVSSAANTQSMTLACTVAANLTAGNATQMIGGGGAGLFSASADL